MENQSETGKSNGNWDYVGGLRFRPMDPSTSFTEECTLIK